MGRAVSRRPLTVEAWVPSQVSPCEVYHTQTGIWTGFSPSTSIFPSASFQQRSVLIFIYMLLLPAGQTGEAWEPSEKHCSFGNRERWIEKYFHFLFHSASKELRSDTLQPLLYGDRRVRSTEKSGCCRCSCDNDCTANSGILHVATYRYDVTTNTPVTTL
jgi:hypothetical protein